MRLIINGCVGAVLLFVWVLCGAVWYLGRSSVLSSLAPEVHMSLGYVIGGPFLIFTHVLGQYTHFLVYAVVIVVIGFGMGAVVSWIRSRGSV